MATKHDLQDPILEDQLGLGNDTEDSEALDKPTKKSDTAESSESSQNRPDTSDELTDGLAKPKPVELRPWYKRPKIWGIITGVTVVIVAILLGLLSWFNSRAQAAWLQDQWRIVGQKSERVVQESERGRYDSFDDTVRALTDLQDTLDDGLTDSQKQPTFLVAGSNLVTYRSTLDELKKYTAKARDEANDLQNVGTAELEDLKSSATQAKLAVEQARDTIKSLGPDLPSGYFALDARYKTVIDEHIASEDEAKAKENASKSKEEQAKQNQADAEAVVTSWIQAYIAAKPTDMKKYMTTAFASEFNFTEVTGSYRQYNYPTTFRRVSTDLKSDYYQIGTAITFVTKSDYTADTNYVNNYTFSVTQDKTSKKWLVNARVSTY